MEKKTIGIVLLTLGIILLIVSVAADPLGIGGGNAVFGPQQIVGTIAGVVVAIVGIALMRRK
jgi:hypothetical protein